MRKLSLIVFICLMYNLPVMTLAQIPAEISYQGLLLSPTGSFVADGTYSLTFRLYSQETGGTALWTETQSASVSGGVFSVMLGSVSTLSLPFDRPYYISTAINGGSELTPRLRLAAVPYSFRARSIDNLSVTSGSITTGVVVRRVNNLTDNVTITAGSNIIVSTSGSTLTISALSGTGATAPGAWREGAGTVYTTASVGVGTTAPLGRLHVAGGSFLVEGTTGSIPVNGGGTRLMWVPSQAAFRAGRTSSGEWNTGFVGDYSFAGGYAPTASATSATAFGWLTTADAPYSTAVGNESGAYGVSSFAAGNRSVAVGSYSAVFGTESESIGTGSFAAGENSTALGNYSAAFGYDAMAGTTASFTAGYESRAEGIASTAFGQQTMALWDGAFTAGWQTEALATCATAFGYGTNADSEYSTAFGYYTRALGRGSFAAGDDCSTSQDYAVVFGNHNISAGANSFSAGEWNWITGDMSFCYGSYGTLHGDYSVIAGGERNRIEEGYVNAVGGGYGNTITSASYSVISGGDVNTIEAGNNNYIGGGFNNRITASYGSVAGGYSNTIAIGGYGTIGGGNGNSITTGSYSTIGGGDSNSVAGDYGTIGGGERNTITSDYGSIPGGYGNSADNYAFAAGRRSSALGNASIAMGDSALATVPNAIALGFRAKARGYGAMGVGFYSVADGDYSRALGYTDTAVGDYSVAMGFYARTYGESSMAFGDKARANHQGAMVLSATYSAGVGDSIASGGAEQLVIRADGGVYISTTAGVAVYNPNRVINTSVGAYLTRGGTWTNASDISLKENLVRVDSRALLDKVSSLPLYRWNYRSENDDVQHIGPMAQDFYHAFGLGGDDRAISTIDPAGISLAAIQALHSENTDLRDRVQKLEELVRQLLEKEKQR